MHIIINAKCPFVPKVANPLSTHGVAMLSLLQAVGYNCLNPPLADLIKQTNNLAGDWVIATPIHWQATHNDAMIIAQGPELGLAEKESHYYFTLYADYLAAENVLLYYYTKDIWLLQVDNKPILQANPPYSLINKSLMPELISLDSTLYWQKFFTEGQMFFASLPNPCAINGMWLWGGAALGAKKNIALCVDDYFFPLAQQCSANVTLYNASLALKKMQVLLLDNLDTMSLSHQEQLKKTSSTWYWQDITYTQNPPKWFNRLWRR